jgi:hypothetical protein
MAAFLHELRQQTEPKGSIHKPFSMSIVLRKNLALTLKLERLSNFIGRRPFFMDKEQNNWQSIPVTFLI